MCVSLNGKINNIMKFFIDTANPSRLAGARPGFDQVTPTLRSWRVRTSAATQPSGALPANLKWWTAMSAEFSTDLEGMLAEAHELSAIHKNIVVKVPARPRASRPSKPSRLKNPTNCTLVFNVGQAFWPPGRCAVRLALCGPPRR